MLDEAKLSLTFGSFLHNMSNFGQNYFLVFYRNSVKPLKFSPTTFSIDHVHVQVTNSEFIFLITILTVRSPRCFMIIISS